MRELKRPASERGARGRGDARSGTPALVLSAVFAAFAALTRYMGAALIICAVPHAPCAPGHSGTGAVEAALTFGAISFAPARGRCWRGNWLVSGTLAKDGSLASGTVPCSIRCSRSSWCSRGGPDPLSQIHWQLQPSPWLMAGLLLLLAALLLVTPRTDSLPPSMRRLLPWRLSPSPHTRRKPSTVHEIGVSPGRLPCFGGGSPLNKRACRVRPAVGRELAVPRTRGG